VLKAVGWRNQDVMLMIVLESLLLSFIGGLLGVGLGFIVSDYAANWTNIPSVINIELITQAMFFALVMGLVGGLYPGYKSTKMNPIEAVR
jgi:putative ABC transport system permease protein